MIQSMPSVTWNLQGSSIRVLLMMAVILVAAPMARANTPDWSALADVETVDVVTEDEDGSLRETKVWLLVHDGRGYVRTGGTAWGANVVRTQSLILRVGDTEYDLRIEFEEADDTRARIKAAFREKYGWSDGMVSWIRGDRPKHMRMVSP